ncbi:hypothetical protein NHJ13734_004740 [Beauveria thailandica]
MSRTFSDIPYRCRFAARPPPCNHTPQPRAIYHNNAANAAANNAANAAANNAANAAANNAANNAANKAL